RMTYPIPTTRRTTAAAAPTTSRVRLRLAAFFSFSRCSLMRSRARLRASLPMCSSPDSSTGLGVPRGSSEEPEGAVEGERRAGPDRDERTQRHEAEVACDGEAVGGLCRIDLSSAAETAAVDAQPSGHRGE